jgi:hypothetical protein
MKFVFKGINNKIIRANNKGRTSFEGEVMAALALNFSPCSQNVYKISVIDK